MVTTTDTSSSIPSSYPPAINTKLLDALPLAASVLDRHGVVCFVNKCWLDYYHSVDYVESALQPGKPYLDLCRADTSENAAASQRIADAITAVLHGESDEVRFDYEHRWKDRHFWYAIRISRIVDVGQTFVLMLHEDVTQRHLEKNDLEEQQRLNELLREVSKKLTSTLNVEEVMQLILESVAPLVPHDAANISLVEGEYVHVAYSRGYTEEFTNLATSYQWPLVEGVYATILASKYALVIDDTNASPIWQHLDSNNSVVSYVGIPIIIHEEVLGFLNLDSFTPRTYTPRHVETLTAFAEHAALAINNARVYVTLDSFNDELSAILRATTALFKPIRPYETTTDLAQEMLEAIQQAFEGIGCGVFLRTDAALDELKCVSSIGTYEVAQRLFNPRDADSVDGMALLSAAYRTRQLVHLPRIASGGTETAAELVVPIITNRGIFALMHLQSHDYDSFQDRDMRILNAFAQHMAVAAENFQLYQTMQQHNLELEDAIVQRTLDLRRAKEDVESILNSTSDAISVLDVEGRILNCNAAFEAAFSIEADEAFRQQMTMFFTPESQSTFQMLFNRVRENGTMLQAEMLADWQHSGSKRKETRVVEVSLTQVERVDDDNVRIVCSVHDISRHKDLMITLQRALEREHELNDMKSQFLSVATHEFRTPLTSITLITGTLQDYWRQLDEQKIKAKLSSIQDQVKRMTSLIDDVLTLGRSEAGEWPFNPREINLPELLAKLGAEWQSALASQHQLFIACSGTEEVLYADPDLLEQILINLVSNAVKYSLPGSQIKIKAQVNESSCTFDVIDHGIGIPEIEQSKLFESFYRASNARKISGVSGTGLGLVIVKRAAELHGGTINFVSAEGQGTTFTVRLPRRYTNPNTGAN